MQNILKKIRKEKNMSQIEFSKYIGVSQPFLSELETNTHNASIKKLKLIANKLGVNWKDLVS